MLAVRVINTAVPAKHTGMCVLVTSLCNNAKVQECDVTGQVLIQDGDTAMGINAHTDP